MMGGCLCEGGFFCVGCCACGRVRRVENYLCVIKFPFLKIKKGEFWPLGFIDIVCTNLDAVSS